MLPRKTVIIPLLLLILSGVVSPAVAGSTGETELDRDQVILRLVQFARAGRLVEAQGLLRDYLAKNPTDGTMHYNLTCLDLLLNQKDEALVDLQRALENGYSNFRLLEVDHDLDRLRDDPRFEPLVSGFKEKFIADFQASAIYLEEGYEPLELTMQRQDSPPMDVLPLVSVAFDAQELRVSVQVADPDCAAEKPPWEGGCGVLVNLIHPVSPDDYDSRRYYSYGFFTRDGQPEAALVGKHGEVLLEAVPGLKPRIVQQGGQVRYEMAIPWEFFTPYAPGLDPEMGLNIFYLGAGEGPHRPVYSLQPENKLAFQPDTWRRYSPVFFLDSDRSSPVMHGRLYNRLTEGNDLGLQLALWSAGEGDAECTLTIHHLSDPGVTVGSPYVEIVPCERELNFFNFILDMAEIPTGSYLLRAELTAPDGMVFKREFPFDNFEKGWLGSLNQRIHQLDNPEQSTLRYHLFLLTRQVEQRHPQSDASFLHEAFDRMQTMIELSEAGGSILPDKGFFLGGFTTGPMTLRHCSMFLPAGFLKNPDLKILMVLPPEPRVEGQLARYLGSAFAGETETIVLVPQSHGYSSLTTPTAAEETVLAMRWAQELFGRVPITLVGLGNGADAALEASLIQPDLCREILLDGDQLYRDLEGFAARTVVQSLSGRVHRRPYTLTSGQTESPRLDLVESTMAKLGYRVVSLPLNGQTLDPAWLSHWFLTKP